jgi:protein TonB
LILPDPPSIHPLDVLPPAPAPRIMEPSPAPVVKAAGFSSLETSGIAPVRRALAATGAFDAAAAAADKITPDKIAPGTFGDASIAAAGARPSQNAPATILSPADILSKPRPDYTDEARRFKIEGEVLLEVLFGASGEARVLRTIRGLGHGLDENAVSAARKIHFRPAQRDGEAVDSTAMVHIVFQLAY